VTLEGSADYSGVEVVLVDSLGGVAGRFTTKVDGRYGFFVAAGAYTVRASTPDYQPGEASVSILPGEIRDGVNISLVH
jgi:hypothetical protein